MDCGVLKEPFTISGNGKQVRDLLFASDCVALYLKAVERIDNIKGQAFNIGGGMENSSSLLELFAFLEKHLQITMEYVNLSPRESDQLVFVAEISKANTSLAWKAEIAKEMGIKNMSDWVCENFIEAS